MKKYFYMVFALALLLLLGGCRSRAENMKIQYYSNENNQQTYVLENGFLKLEMDGQTGYFTLFDKVNGAVWNSVPEGGASDPAADTDAKNKMQSTLIVNYTDRTGNTFTYNNYTYGISGGTFQITEQDGVLILDYMLGPEKRNFTVPEAISESRMQEMLDQMEKEDKAYVLKIYRKFDLSKIKDPERQQELLKYLPQLETEVMYALSQATGGDQLKDYQMEQLERIFLSIGYTEEQAKEDKVQSEESEDVIQINISVHYRLDGDALVAEVPQEKMRYQKDYPVTQIRILPYLCAAGDEDEGYLLVPDGGGGQIFFHNGKTGASTYLTDVYGFDEVFEREVRIQETRAAFPVFGIAKNGSYLLAVAEGCAADMAVEADVAGKKSSYDYVCPVFNAVHGEETSISQKTESSIFVAQSEQPTQTISVRYYSGGSDSYADMARRYRTYLETKYPQLVPSDEQGLPLVVEFIGIIDKSEKILGIPVRQTYAAADYSEVYAVMEKLTDIDNLRIRYSAVLNGGMDQTELSSAKVESKLGTTAQRRNLLNKIGEMGAGLYINGYAELVMNRSWLLSSSNTVRNTMNTVVKRYPFLQNTQEVTGKSEDSIFLMSMDSILSSMDTLAYEAENWNNAGIGFSDVGSVLYSDFSNKNNVSREEMMLAQAQKLAALREQGINILVDVGFDYAAVNADCICNMDLQGAQYDIVDRQIPFYQIALHGYVSYTGTSLNAGGNYRREVLKSVETGAGLSFTFFESDYQELRGNRYTYQNTLYGANFSDWEEELLSLYHRMNEELGHVNNQTISDHCYLSQTVTCTRYSDGTAVYVNYGAESWTGEGITVPAEDWAVVKGG